MTISQKLPPRQAEVLELVRQQEVQGICIRYIWTFTVGSRVVTREVRGLLNKGLVSMICFSGGRAALSVK